MFNTVCKALIGNCVEDGRPILLASNQENAPVEDAMTQWRAFLTGVAASPQLDSDTYEKVMSTIRSLRIIDVRVTQVETI